MKCSCKMMHAKKKKKPSYMGGGKMKMYKNGGKSDPKKPEAKADPRKAPKVASKKSASESLSNQVKRKIKKITGSKGLFPGVKMENGGKVAPMKKKKAGMTHSDGARRVPNYKKGASDVRKEIKAASDREQHRLGKAGNPKLMMEEGGKMPKPKALAKYRKVQGKGEAAAEAGKIKKAKRKFARSAKLFDKAYGK